MKSTALIKYVVITLFFSKLNIISIAQVGVNADGSPAHSSAMLDVKSNSRGFLAPRMSQAQRDAIASPVAGLMIYQTDGTAGYYVHNGSAWAPLTGAGGSKWLVNGNNIYNSNAGFVGIGTSTPGSGLELKGAAEGAQMRLTDPGSGNSLVLQGGANENIKITGYNYGLGAARPLYLSVDGANTYLNPNGGAVGIGMTSPTHALDVYGFFRARHPAGGNVVSETNGGVNAWAKLWVRTPVQSWSIGTSHTFNGNQLYFSNETNGGAIRMAIMPNGNVGIGTTNPLSGLEVGGTGIQTQQRITDYTSGNSLVLQSGAGGNMKITGYNYGSSTAVPLHLSTDGANTVLNSSGGNVLQPGSGYGMPKAMLYVNGDGSVLRCYNGISGATSGDCGISVSRSSPGEYVIGFGFAGSNRFCSLSLQDRPNSKAVGISFQPSASGSGIVVFVYETNRDYPATFQGTDRPFMLIVY